jgi:purine nucleoside phosphorylase
MDIQFDTAALRQRLRATDLSGEQVESVTEAVHSALANQEQKAELRAADLKRLDGLMVTLQRDVYRLEAELEFARKLAQTSVIGMTGLFLLLMFVL